MAAYLDAAITFALKKAGKDENVCLKAEQRAIIEVVVCSKKDVLGVLPTGFGKSLVFHLLSDVLTLLMLTVHLQTQKLSPLSYRH